MLRFPAFALLVLASCNAHDGGDRAAGCACAPAGHSSDKLLGLLRRHQSAVADGRRNGRDTKLIDDEIRVQAAIACEPCGGWVGERALPEDLYPLDRLADADGAVCLGLHLRDGSVAYGDARPEACTAK